MAYPDRDVGWGKKIVLQAPGTPKWFNQWARAVGLPVRWLEESKNLANMATAKEDEKSLLILGKSSAGESLGQLLAAYSKHDCNLLVLEAKWFGTPAGPVAVRARHMHAGLAEIGKQSWAKSLAFSFHRNPLGGIVNRWPWTDGPDGPLVEQVQRSTLGLLAQQHCPVVLSYLPWQCQLGRNDLADQMLLALLEASARAKGAELASAIGWVWPERIEPEDRPVLTRACNPQSHKRGHVFVLDVRGDGFPADHQWKGGQAWEQTKMLILGDDKRLDESKWLKLDRAKKIAHRPGVVWLSDDELPPSRKNQIRLMHELTQLGVPLARPGQEE